MRVNPEKMKQALIEIAMKVGCNATEAADLAENIVLSEMRGMSSHGVMRMPSYMERIEMGLYATNVTPEIIQDGGTLLLLDGKNGLGAPVAKAAMRLCVERAKETGVAFVGVCHGNHFGMTADYVKYAAEQGCIAMCCANANAWVAPIGGNKKKLGTNPLALGLPGTKDLFLLDMATSEAAQGKVVIAEKKGMTVPPTWGVDASGAPTTDPSAILHGGALLPFGGPKGYGISLMIEILCSALAGGVRSTSMGSMFDRDKIIGTGFFMGAIDIARITDLEEFKANVQSIFEDMRDAGTPEKPVFLPGEIEQNKAKKAAAEGFEVAEAIYQDLEKLATRLGVTLDVAM